MPGKGSRVNNKLDKWLIVPARTNIAAEHQLHCKDQKYFSTQRLTFLNTLKSSHMAWVVSTWPEEFGCHSWRLQAWQCYVTALSLLQLQVPVCFIFISLDPQLRHIKSTHTLGNGFSWVVSLVTPMTSFLHVHSRKWLWNFAGRVFGVLYLGLIMGIGLVLYSCTDL